LGFGLETEGRSICYSLRDSPGECQLGHEQRCYGWDIDGDIPTMGRCILWCVSILALVEVAAPFGSAEPTASDQSVWRSAASIPGHAEGNCEARIQALDASQAEGEERLREKRAVIELCFDQYKRDKTIVRLVMDCAKYEKQPVVSRQLVAECQLAAFNYANALNALREEYRK